jgi:predicted NUDIX family NTP pyrophosphohydrolase
MGAHSAGMMMYRRREGRLEVLLVHPGGPFWANKDAGAWSIPKGKIADGEEPIAAAQREFQEETGLAAQPPFLALGSIRQKGGKIVNAWAFEGDCDPAALTSNTATLEWPPGSGRLQTFPEVDRAAFFTFDEARVKINAAQAALLDELARQLSR